MQPGGLVKYTGKAEHGFQGRGKNRTVIKLSYPNHTYGLFCFSQIIRSGR